MINSASYFLSPESITVSIRNGSMGFRSPYISSFRGWNAHYGNRLGSNRCRLRKTVSQTTQIPCDKLPTYQQAMKINEGNNFAVILVNCNTVWPSFPLYGFCLRGKNRQEILIQDQLNVCNLADKILITELLDGNTGIASILCTEKNGKYVSKLTTNLVS